MEEMMDEILKLGSQKHSERLYVIEKGGEQE
ncbi:hypothetical protein M199_gp259 [Halogranum tailed virus 1]|uniref:Uncharacterized protein n=1 Tax=Halogranum tailed virus 1 TaxID=1273749 RepID=R4TL69_9CAUD|nr:hypothetical protein M199_gp259 [Halogranum tailed virus 1]AGM11407.1 hypothetical protein HGTV1_109 [Halogranum tailed virus 1]